MAGRVMLPPVRRSTRQRVRWWIAIAGVVLGACGVLVVLFRHFDVPDDKATGPGWRLVTTTPHRFSDQLALAGDREAITQLDPGIGKLLEPNETALVLQSAHGACNLLRLNAMTVDENELLADLRAYDDPWNFFGSCDEKSVFKSYVFAFERDALPQLPFVVTEVGYREPQQEVVSSLR